MLPKSLQLIAVYKSNTCAGKLCLQIKRADRKSRKKKKGNDETRHVRHDKGEGSGVSSFAPDLATSLYAAPFFFFESKGGLSPGSVSSGIGAQ